MKYFDFYGNLTFTIVFTVVHLSILVYVSLIHYIAYLCRIHFNILPK